MCLCVYVHVCVYSYVNVCMCVYMHVFMCMCVSMRVHLLVRVCICLCVCSRVHVCMCKCVSHRIPFHVFDQRSVRRQGSVDRWSRDPEERSIKFLLSLPLSFHLPSPPSPASAESPLALSDHGSCENTFWLCQLHARRDRVRHCGAIVPVSLLCLVEVYSATVQHVFYSILSHSRDPDC